MIVLLSVTPRASRHMPAEVMGEPASVLGQVFTLRTRLGGRLGFLPELVTFPLAHAFVVHGIEIGGLAIFAPSAAVDATALGDYRLNMPSFRAGQEFQISLSRRIHPNAANLSPIVIVKGREVLA